jgi:thiaminase
MSARARELLEVTRRQLAPAETRNRFVELATEGALPLGAFRAFACEEYRTTHADLRSFSVLASRFPHGPAGKFFRELVAGEVTAIERLVEMGAALGMDPSDLGAHEPDPRCQAYPAYVAWLALNGSSADATLALVANFAAWGHFCRQTSLALQNRYGLDSRATGFLDLFGGVDDSTETHEADELALAIIEQSLSGGADANAAQRAARLLQAYELMFWDALAE